MNSSSQDPVGHPVSALLGADFDAEWPRALSRLKHTEPHPDQGIACVGTADLAMALDRLEQFADVALGNAMEVSRLLDAQARIEAQAWRPLQSWIKEAMRFIDLCDADAADYADNGLHDHAENLMERGFAFFGAGERDSLATIERMDLEVVPPVTRIEAIEALREAVGELQNLYFNAAGPRTFAAIDKLEALKRALLSPSTLKPSQAEVSKLHWRHSDKDLPVRDATEGERWLLTYHQRTGTYDIGCIDGNWRHGETIDVSHSELWAWLPANPEIDMADGALGRQDGTVQPSRDEPLSPPPPSTKGRES